MGRNRLRFFIGASLAAVLFLTGQSGCFSAATVLIVNGDDVGISRDFTDATVKAFDAGAIDSVSLVANGPDTDRAIAILLARPDIPVGLHFTLVGDWKPLSDGVSLRGADGNLHSSTQEAAAEVLPEDAAAEFDAQLDKLLSAGLSVQCADTHMQGYFTTNAIYAAVFQRAKARGIPIISGFYQGMPEDWRPFLAMASYQGIYGLPNGKAENPHNRAEAYWSVLSRLRPGTHYFYSHQGLGFADENPSEDRLIRIDDSAFWTDPETKHRLSALRIERGSTARVRESFLAALKANGGW